MQYTLIYPALQTVLPKMSPTKPRGGKPGTGSQESTTAEGQQLQDSKERGSYGCKQQKKWVQVWNPTTQMDFSIRQNFQQNRQQECVK